MEKRKPGGSRFVRGLLIYCLIFLLLVIDGRRATSLGASYKDLAEQMLAFGAINAGNLDGGSSSLMWMDGGYINNTAAVIGVRPIPTAFLVMP